MSRRSGRERSHDGLVRATRGHSGLLGASRFPEVPYGPLVQRGQVQGFRRAFAADVRFPGVPNPGVRAGPSSHPLAATPIPSRAFSFPEEMVDDVA
jgi:hypothetical protein